MSNISPEQAASIRAASKVQIRLQAAKESGDTRTIQLISIMGITEILQILEGHPLAGMLFHNEINAAISLMDQLAETLDAGGTFTADGEYGQLIALLREDQAVVRGVIESNSSEIPPQ